MERVVAVIEPILTPLVILCLTTMGGWGTWVTIGTYDANAHVKEYEQISSELRATTIALRDVQMGLAEQRIITDSMLTQILDEVKRPESQASR